MLLLHLAIGWSGRLVTVRVLLRWFEVVPIFAGGMLWRIRPVLLRVVGRPLLLVPGLLIAGLIRLIWAALLVIIGRSRGLIAGLHRLLRSRRNGPRRLLVFRRRA